MSNPRRGCIYWLYPQDSTHTNQLGIAIAVNDRETLFMMCVADSRLAGHLDAIVRPSQSGLPYTVSIFTHVVQWVHNDLIGLDPVGELNEDQCVELEEARAGRSLHNLRSGSLLGDPSVEPRWPLIEKYATEFVSSLDPDSYSELWINDKAEFERQLNGVLNAWDTRTDDHDAISQIIGLYANLRSAWAEHQEWCPEFIEITNDIEGAYSPALMAA